MRPALVAHIRECAAAAKSGKEARIRIKVNHLADEEIVTELYAAADAGVEVEIFARTTCTLWPRKRDGKEDIRVRSLLGRFFEHSRFFIFQAGGKTTYLLGSADLMPRNLDHRIEILVPSRTRAASASCPGPSTRSWRTPAGRGRSGPTGAGSGCGPRRGGSGRTSTGL